MPSWGSESALRRAVLRQIRRRWQTAWVLGGRHSTAGVGDFIICHEGRFIMLELKTAHGRVTPLQAATLAKIRRAGGQAMVVRRVEDLDAWS